MEYIYFEGEEAKATKIEGYFVTKSGLVISVKVKGGTGKLDFNNPRIHNTKTDKDGYKEVLLCEKGKRIYYRVHRLIWETYNGEIKDDLTVDHINNIPYDNRLENLQLLTREANAVKRHKNWVKDKRCHYKVIDGEKECIMDRFEIEEVYGLALHDINRLNAGFKTKKYLNSGLIIEKV